VRAVAAPRSGGTVAGNLIGQGVYPVRQEKLVRDGIPEIIRASGGRPVIRTVGADEYRELLRAKLSEEVQEFLDSDADPEELADILEVVLALAEDIGISWGELDKIRAAKAEERGGFARRIAWKMDAEGD
jgi:predicted house-cleaning noncanonical NTP pyrophosphatase (MazG superfamily)